MSGRQMKKHRVGHHFKIVEEQDDKPKAPTLSIPNMRYSINMNNSANFRFTTSAFEIPCQQTDTTDNVPSTIEDVDIPSDLCFGVDPAYVDNSLDTRIIEIDLSEVICRTAHDPIRRWLPDREIFLAEFLRREGRGNHTYNICPLDHTNNHVNYEAHYRCLDCTGGGGALLCKHCMVELHRWNPLHRIKRWMFTHFDRVSLRDLGLRVQLGHIPSSGCGNSCRRASDDFVVIDTTGIHKVSVDFCDCEQSQPFFIQLLRHGWFPATVDRPKTAATFNVLQHFQLLSFESKASSFEFYTTLKRLSENTGVTLTKDRYRSFMTMVQEYRHLKMLKQSSRGHNPLGVQATKPGECAILCPACPHVKHNLPMGWENTSPERRFLYSLFIAIDANFRLKRKNKSSEAADPSLSKGWSYFVPQDEYSNFINEFNKLVVQPKSTCSNHNAVNAERATKGLAATGVVAVDCSRHNVKRPVAVGDVIGGEKYIFSDFVFLYSLKDRAITEFTVIMVSYNIVCQWSVNLWERMRTYRHELFTDENGKKAFRFLIPKFHLPGHILKCQTIYSFNYNHNVGRTDGEGIERGWSNINPVATSTREMGPGHRRDTLDDHFGDWNWKKSCLMGVTLLRKLKEAVIEAHEHRLLHSTFEGSLTSANIESFTLALEAWEADHKQPNPFEKQHQVISQDAVRMRLASKEADELKAGRAYVLHEEISALQMIVMGMDFEEKQRRLADDWAALGNHATDKQKTKLINRSNILHRQITAWIEVQELYMPALAAQRVRDMEAHPKGEDSTHKIKLYLPSSLKAPSPLLSCLPSHSSAPAIPCDLRLCEIEWELQNPQASDSLANLRDTLRLIAYLNIDKRRFQRGQRQNTQSRNIIARTEAKKEAAVSSYRVARAALLGLGGWLGKEQGLREVYPELLSDDARAMTDAESTAIRSGCVSEGRRTMSWIWFKIGDMEQEDEELQDDLRIEWCKSKACTERWQEEVLLLTEEMRRVKAFFSSMQAEWLSRSSTTVNTGIYDDGATKEGRSAYAFGQAAMYREMERRCLHLWRHVDEFVKLGSGVLIPEDIQEEEEMENNDDPDDADPTNSQNLSLPVPTAPIKPHEIGGKSRLGSSKKGNGRSDELNKHDDELNKRRHLDVVKYSRIALKDLGVLVNRAISLRAPLTADDGLALVALFDPIAQDMISALQVLQDRKAAIAAVPSLGPINALVVVRESLALWANTTLTFKAPFAKSVFTADALNVWNTRRRHY
ncbi:hypothetical protein DXG01_015688 [Tephrocybe rancida]|nr:hypothetical protein DXG01_015688 [Tephrocybe rancida]